MHQLPNIWYLVHYTKTCQYSRRVERRGREEEEEKKTKGERKGAKSREEEQAKWERYLQGKYPKGGFSGTHDTVSSSSSGQWKWIVDCRLPKVREKWILVTSAFKKRKEKK